MDTTIKHNGIVERIKDGIIYVKITQHSACAECQASAMCTASEKKEKIIEIATPANETFREKEEVLVCGKSSLGLLAVVYAFICGNSRSHHTGHLLLCALFATK